LIAVSATIIAIIIRRLFSNGVLWSFLYIATIIVE
jgi:hypothetical protein